MKGWYIPSRSDGTAGESTAWYSAFWAFAGAYLHERFDRDWALSPEQPLSLHVGNQTVPRQLVVRSPRAGNHPTQLPHGITARRSSTFVQRSPMAATSRSRMACGSSLCPWR